MSRYISLREEAAADYGNIEPTSASVVMKLLSESINTTREDFFPETTEFWTVDSKAEGFFRTSGDFEVLVDPIQWPKLLAYFIGDGTSAPAQGGGPFDHTFLFGANETVSTTGVKAFTLGIGVGIEKDRGILGTLIESLSIEAVNREVVSCTVSVVGSGEEKLWTAWTPTYASYTQPYLTFGSASTMTIGGTDRLTTAPTIEAFRLTLSRGLDADHYVLGKRFLSAATLSGMASVEGTMDLSFTSEDEHERFLTAVGSYISGDQASFALVMNLRGAVASGAQYYEVEFTIPETYYTGSTANVSGRDRIVQTVNFRGNYASGTAAAAKIRVRNMTTSYATLAN